MTGPQARADLRKRRADRRQRMAANEQILAEQKRRAIRGPDDEAAYAYDQVRKRIKQTRDPVKQANRWLRLAQILDDFGGDLE